MPRRDRNQPKQLPAVRRTALLNAAFEAGGADSRRSEEVSFHFLLCRLRERDWIADKSNADVIKQLSDCAAQWKAVVVQDLRDAAAQVERWKKVLGTT